MMHTRRAFLNTVAGAAISTSVVSHPGWKLLAADTASNAKITDVSVIRVREKGKNAQSPRAFLEITTDQGARGISGELFMDTPARLEELRAKLLDVLRGQDPADRQWCCVGIWDALYPGKPLRRFEEGIDPLTGQLQWDTRRARRHTPTGTVMMGISAVDNALWDLRGKLAGKPVRELLGGTRTQLGVYLSLTPDDDMAETRRTARSYFNQGFKAQKWFLRHGPPDGEAGFKFNVGVVESIRSELGAEAQLMFDFAVGGRGRCDWDLPYAIRLAKAIAPFQPFWLEEPFSPEEIESYARLHGETGIPLATGEHTYSRWNIKPFLDRGLVRFIQCDPEWCGGLSELLEIANLAKSYDGIRLIPHGHHVLAAANLVSSQSESLCPLVEYGVTFTKGRQAFQTRVLFPDAGRLSMPTEPGLGPDLDWDRLERV